MALAITKYGSFYYFEPDVIGRVIAEGGFWDEHLRPYIDVLTPDSVMVDVGANIGFHTIYAASRGVTVHAFEASYEVFCLLMRNVEKNWLCNNVREYNNALYDRQVVLDLNPQWTDFVANVDGRVDYERSPNSGGLSLVPAEKGRWYARPLDDFELERVDLLKIDVQGADLRVLVGARELLRRSKPVICFEFEHNGSGVNASGDKLEHFESYLSEFGYKIKAIGGNYSTWTDYVAEPQ